MARSSPLGGAVGAVFGGLVASCTFGGLGDYPICAYPAASALSGVGAVVSPTDLVIASGGHSSPVAAYVTNDGCLEAIDEASGYVAGPSCSLLVPSTGLVAHQPYVVDVSGGEAVFVTTGTAAGPCASGQVAFTNKLLTGQAAASSPAVLGGDCAPSSTAALPSFAALPGGTIGIAAWYQTAIGTRRDPLASCAAAIAAPLVVALVSNPAASAPTFADSAALATDGIGVRPPALIPRESTGGAILAAPTAAGVGLWTFDATGRVAPPVVIAALAGARAVAVATDGADRVATVAEIGCSPQRIALSTGTPSGGFNSAVEVAPAGADAAFQPTVAWVSSRQDWLVTWISRTGGSHLLARRFSAAGLAEDAAFDPKLAAGAAMAGADGRVFAIDAKTGQFETADLACVP